MRISFTCGEAPLPPVAFIPIQSGRESSFNHDLIQVFVSFNQRSQLLSSFRIMSLFNNVLKLSLLGGAVIGGAVAYGQLSPDERQKIKNAVTRARRKLSDLIAPNDGVYTIPKEVEAELQALINDDN